VWTTAGKWVAQLVGWASTIVVARLLAPEDYGLVGMATIYLGLISLLAEFGLGSAVVILPDLHRDQLAQLNSLSVLIGIASVLVSCALAQPIASFFATPALIPVIVAMSGGFVITAFRVVPQALIQRDLRFKELAYVEVAQTVVLAGVMVALAVLGLRYWTLVIGGLGSGLLTTLTMIMLRPAPFAWPRRAVLGPAVTFSWRVMMSRLGWFVQVHSDFLVAGKFLGQQALGLYNLAWSIATVPVEKIAAIVTRVMPAFLAAVQTDAAALRRYLLGLTEALALLTFPAAAGMALVADDFVTVAFGDRWQGAVMPLRLLAIHAAYQAVAALPGQVMVVVGEARFAMWASLATAVVLPVGFYFGSRWGVSGIATVWVVLYPVLYAVVYRRALRRIELSLRGYLAVLRPALHTCILMAVAVLLCRGLAANATPTLRLGLQITAGAAVYAALVLGPYRGRTRALLEFLRGGTRAHAPVSAASAPTPDRGPA
jgi:PST family polysaccharide transporter